MSILSGSRIGYLFRGFFDGAPLDLWTGHGDLTYGGVTYVGSGELLEISGSASTTGNRLAGLTVSLAGMDPETISIAENEPFQRRRVLISLIWADAEWNVAGSEVFFDGIADNISNNNDPSNPVITMSLEPRALDLQRVRPFRYLPQDQRTRYANDAFFDMVQSLQTQELKIGT
ncbi:hypothetical protein [Mangrovicoccus sp. HB161399]|uniref:hypothetical protein n=1 Tax=Mangrovicoccus sp. HB161399 TaxID=2720392 RepID=UPI001554F396|nr:hypothetical protein [Mangrovicoccus sp. HB161399]